MEISVVTSITAGKDTLLDQPKSKHAKYLCFADKPVKSKTWEILPAYDRFKDARRNSRIHKMLIHQYTDTEYSIWIDGNIQLNKPPEELIERFLKDADIGFFTHQTRDCIYDEAMTCAKSKLDDPEIIIAQAKAYEDSGFAKHKGLYIGNFILRRNTPKVEAFNNAWWGEYCRHSVRDQISLPYALDKAGLRAKGEYAPWVFSSNNLYAVRGDAIKIYPHVIKNPPIV